LLVWGLALLCSGQLLRADTVFSTALDSAPAGWTVQGDWAFGMPDGTDSADPSSGHTGSNVYGVCLSGYWQVWEWTTFYVSSSSIDCSDFTDVKLDFWRWLNMNYFQEMPEFSDYVCIEVSTNGGSTWTVIWTTTQSIRDSSWQHVIIDVPAASGQSNVRFRWGYRIGEMPSGGWNIDDISVTGNRAAPTVTGISPTDGSSVGTPSNIDITFSSPVFGVDATDLELSGAAYLAGTTTVGTPTDLGSNAWRFPISGLTDGTLNLSLAPDANDIEDANGNDLAPVAWSYTVDATPPTVTGRSPAPDSTLNVPDATIDVTLSETVGTLQTSDMALSGTAGGTVNSVQLVSGTTYRFTIGSLGLGSLTVTLAPSANTIEDAAGNDLAPVSWSYTVSDTIAPTIAAIAPADGATVGAHDFDLDITFSEAVSGVDATDLVVSGTSFMSGLSAIGTPTNTSGNTWRFAISGLRNGTFEASFAPDADDVEDAAGNDVPNTSWSYTIDYVPVQTLDGQAVALNAHFGIGTAIDGDTAVVGANGEKVTLSSQGTAYVYAWDGTEWQLAKKLVASDAKASDQFGGCVAISGDTVVVAATGVDISTKYSAGAVYVFQRDWGGANQWGQVTRITAPDAAGYDYFGQSVAVEGDTVVVGRRSGEAVRPERGALGRHNRGLLPGQRQQRIGLPVCAQPGGHGPMGTAQGASHGCAGTRLLLQP
jgi:hypothetical protein